MGVRRGIRGVLASLCASLAVLGAVCVAPSATAAGDLGPVRAAESQITWAPRSTAAIRPGVLTETAGGGACTSNFVFTAGERTFLGQAAHCGGTGDATETDGCDSGTVPVGTPVVIRGADGSARNGRMAYSSWVDMQARGVTDRNLCLYNDLALVELDPADVAVVNPSLPFFGGPTGLDTDGLVAGEAVFGYGNSPAALGIATLIPKVGTAAPDVGDGLGHEIFTVAPGVPGDSGSAFVDAAGRAVGILSTLNLAPLPVSNGVIDLAGALAYAEANAGFGPITLVAGTEPFTSAPAGVAPEQLSSPAGPPLGAG